MVPSVDFKTRPLVSVIIAACNAEAYIAKAINSARAQSERRIEIIVIDDGSIDATAGVARGIAALDERVIVIRQNENRGVSAARNAGLAQANGAWIAVLDADDEFAPQRLEIMLAEAERHQADLIADNLQMHDFETGAPLGRAFPEAWMRTDHDISIGYILERDIPGIYEREIGFFKPIIRRDFLTAHGIKYAEDIYAAEDFLLYAECLLQGGRLRFMPDALYRYAMRTGSLSSLKLSNESCKKVCDILLRKLATGNVRDIELLRLRRDATNYELFIWHVKQRRFISAFKAATEMPVLFTARRLSVFLLRKFGLRLNNPTVRHLEVIQRRTGRLQAE